MLSKLSGVFLLSAVALINGDLVGGIIVPHGDFAYDPTLFPSNSFPAERHLSERIASASRKAGKFLAEELNPDVILLSTPHGIKLDTDFGIYMGEKGEGYATIGADLHNNSISRMYNVSLAIQMDLDMSKELLSILQKKENVSGIYSYNSDTPMPLNWGEIIPLLLLPKTQQRKKYIIWSHPQRRYENSQEMVPELLRVGKQIAIWAQQRPEKIAIIISGDLSHTHSTLGPYGYSNASAPFDAALGTWAANPCTQAQSLLQHAKRLQKQALSCGFTGFALWHGMLTASKRMAPNVLDNLNVTYYGMMAATFASTTSSTSYSSNLKSFR